MKLPLQKLMPENIGKNNEWQEKGWEGKPLDNSEFLEEERHKKERYSQCKQYKKSDGMDSIISTVSCGVFKGKVRRYHAHKPKDKKSIDHIEGGVDRSVFIGEDKFHMADYESL